MIVSFMIIRGKTMKQNRFIKKFFVVALMAFAVSVFLGEASSDAASKAKLSSKKANIAVNESITISLTGKVKKAYYQFTSKNKKIATVSNKGVIKGVAAGKAKISVVQKLNKKKTNVGTFTVTVKKAGIYSSFKTGTVISNQPGVYKDNPYYLEVYEYITYINYKAKYKVYSSDTKKLPMTEDGIVKEVNGEGTVNVTFKETYKGKTRTIGSIKVELCAPSYTGKKDAQMYKNEIFYVDNYLQNVGKYYLICSYEDKVLDPNEFEASKDNGEDSEEDDIIQFVEDSNGDWNGGLKGLAEGKRYICIYAYDYNNEKYIEEPFASFTLTVNAVKTAEAITTDLDSYDEDDEEYDSSTSTLTLGVNDTKIYSVYQKPYNYTEDIKVTSSDSSVVKVAEFEKTEYYDEDEGYIGKMFVTPVKAGKATITLEANGFKKTYNIVVKDYNSYSDSDEYYQIVMLDKDIPLYDGDEEVSESDFTLKSSDESIVSGSISDVRTDSNSKYIKAVGLDLQNGSKAGKVTLTISYKGEKVGTLVFTTVSEDDYDDDSDYDDDNDYGDDDDYYYEDEY